MHTATSKMFAKNPLMCEWVEMTAGEVLPAALKFADAMEKWPGSEEPNHTVSASLLIKRLSSMTKAAASSLGYKK